MRDGLKSTIRLWPIIASGRTDLSKTVIGDVVRREGGRQGGRILLELCECDC